MARKQWFQITSVLQGKQSIYFEALAEAESALKKRTPIELIEPSDAERTMWPDATRNYVEQLEQFYDNHNR